MNSPGTIWHREDDPDAEPGVLSPPPGVPARSPARKRLLLLTYTLLPAAVASWAAGISMVDVAAIGPLGLPAILPVAYFAGLAVLVLSAAIELSRPDISGWRMSLHSIALVVMLYGTAPLVYREGRYSWLYKTVGVVQYINAHGRLNSHIDIYQNWPGFFAIATWFDRIAGVTTPLAYAKWAQLIFELAAIPLLYLIYDALRLTTRQRWVAILLFSASNWIGQDYFSPQALGMLLSLGIMAIAMRWLYVHRPPRRRTMPTAGADRPAAPPFPPRKATLAASATVCLIFTVLTFTHELSPYMLVVQLGALALVRLLRPAWLPVVLLAIAIAYFAPRFAFVNSHFGLLASIGAFFTNVTPPSFSQLTVTPDQQFIQRSALLLSLAIWALAVIGAWLRRRAGHTVLTLVLLAFSPFVLLALAAYGHEGVLRVYLFSLPWSAALASCVLTPEAEADLARPSDAAGRPDSESEARKPILRTFAESLLAPAALLASLTLFIPAFFGDDATSVMSKQTVTTIASFLRNAQPGPLLVAFNRAPVADTANYNKFELVTIFGPGGVLGVAPYRPTLATVLAIEALKRTGGTKPAYLIVTPTMIAYNNAYQLVKPYYLISLLDEVRHSAHWQLVVANAGAVIYQLRPAYPLNLGPPKSPTSLGQR